MTYNLEYEPLELESGFGEELEMDGGELESDFGEFETDSEFDTELPPGAQIRFNLPKIGDRSGFQELEAGVQEEVFPPDTRVAVTDTTKVPYRFICHLLIGLKAGDGTLATGRGSGP